MILVRELLSYVSILIFQLGMSYSFDWLKSIRQIYEPSCLIIHWSDVCQRQKNAMKVLNSYIFTGVSTGSVYKDVALLRNGFPSESVNNGSVIVVKTHEYGASVRDSFDAAILIIR